jgi:hypothetical protein
MIEIVRGEPRSGGEPSGEMIEILPGPHLRKERDT